MKRLSLLHAAVGVCLLLGNATADVSFASSSVEDYQTLAQRSSSGDLRSLIPVAPYLLLQPESNASSLILRAWNLGAAFASFPEQEARGSQVGYVLFARKDLRAVQLEAEVSQQPPTPRPPARTACLTISRKRCST